MNNVPPYRIMANPSNTFFLPSQLLALGTSPVMRRSDASCRSIVMGMFDRGCLVHVAKRSPRDHVQIIKETGRIGIGRPPVSNKSLGVLWPVALGKVVNVFALLKTFGGTLVRGFCRIY